MLNISGFSDEISDSFEEQLALVTQLGMKYISIRGLYGRNICDFTEAEVASTVEPALKKYGVSVSSIGSPIGKIFIDEQDAYALQLEMLLKICHFAKLLNCHYIRVFSFYIPEGCNPDDFKNQVIEKLAAFLKIAEQHGVVLLHENEKGIFGDTAGRCKTLFDELQSKNFRAIFDFANFVQIGQDPTAAFEMLFQFVDYIHVKDARFDASFNVLCGSGDGNIEELLGRFLRNGYNGFLTLEPHLAMFAMLSELELEEAEKVIGDSNLTGPEAYRQSYQALCRILQSITAPQAEDNNV